MITITLDQGPLAQAKIDFRPSSESTTEHGLVMKEAQALIDSRLAEIKAAKNPAPAQVVAEVPAENPVPEPEQELEQEPERQPEPVILPPSPHALPELPDETPAPAADPVTPEPVE